MSKDNFSMANDFKIVGRWKRPRGKYIASGTLEYTENKMELHLLGAFDDAFGESPFQRRIKVGSPKVIHGLTAKKKKVTLIRNFYTFVQPGGNFLSKSPVKVIESRLLTNGILFGCHLKSLKEECFEKCILEIPNIERWLDSRPFDTKMSEEGASISFVKPKDIFVFKPENFGEFRLRNSYEVSGMPWEESSVTHNVRVVITPTNPKSITWFQKVVSETERMFALLFGRVVQVKKFMLITKEGNEYDNLVNVFYCRERNEEKEMNPHEFLVRYPELQDHFSVFVEKWFSKTVEMKDITSIIYSELYRPSSLLETKFIPFVQAIEIFTRAIDSLRFVEKSEFKKIRKQIEKAIPEWIPTELRASIVNGLAHANDGPLRDRIVALIGQLKHETRELFCVIPEDFARGIVDTRNYLTHFSKKPGKSILKGMQLYWATQKLHVMSKVLILTAMGIPEDLVCKIIKTNHYMFSERKAWRLIPELGRKTDNNK